MMDASVEIPEKYGFAVDEDSYKKCAFCSRSIDGKSTRDSLNKYVSDP
jgi:hypothetical protein